MLRFVREIIALRRRHPSLTANRFFTGTPVPSRDLPDIAWHGIHLDAPPWHEAEGRFLRFTIAGLDGAEEDLHVILNMTDQPVDLDLPDIPSRRWHLAFDTAAAPPGDIIARDRQHPLTGSSLSVRERSVAVLEAR
jgi:glycogen operon protein